MIHFTGESGISFEDQRRIGNALNAIFQDSSTNLYLTLNKMSSDGTSRWILERATNPTQKFYVKMKFGAQDLFRYIYERQIAIRMAKRHPETPPYLGSGIWLIYKKETEQEMHLREFGIHQLLDVSCDYSDAIVIEIQMFGGLDLRDMVKRLEMRNMMTFEDHVITNKLVKTLHYLHSRKILPADLDIKAPSVIPSEEKARMDREFEEAKARKYRTALLDIPVRLFIHCPPNMVHPTLTDNERHELYDISERMVKEWSGRTERISHLHGDLRVANLCLAKDKERERISIHPIDFNRNPFGEPRWDDGRLIADLGEAYLKTGSPAIAQMIKQLVKRSESETGDEHYRAGLCLGILSMTAIKLDLFLDPIHDKDLSRRYLDQSLRILRQGYFDHW